MCNLTIVRCPLADSLETTCCRHAHCRWDSCVWFHREHWASQWPSHYWMNPNMLRIHSRSCIWGILHYTNPFFYWIKQKWTKRIMAIKHWIRSRYCPSGETLEKFSFGFNYNFQTRSTNHSLVTHKEYYAKKKKKKKEGMFWLKIIQKRVKNAKNIVYEYNSRNIE